MSPSNITTRARRTPMVAVSALLLLSACGSGSTPNAASTSAGGPSAGTDLAAQVEQLQKPVESYPVPTQPVTGAAGVRGRTVYYVPVAQQAPQFQVTGAALKSALGKVGVTVQTCDGNGVPTAISACVTQATAAKAGAIITDAYPYGMAANALDAAVNAGIPVLNTSQVEDSQHPASDKLGYIYPGSDQMIALADWIANDAHGKASVVVNQNNDGPAPPVFGAAGKEEFTKNCSGCSWTVNGVSTANFSLVASSTSAALLKTPDVNYVVVQFEQFLQPTIGGVQQANKTANVKGLAGAAQLTSLQMLASKNFLYAAVGQDATYQAWADADAVIRMMTGTPGTALPKYTIPIRLFTRDNVGSLALTPEAQSSGEWFGPANYVDPFLKLWGVS